MEILLSPVDGIWTDVYGSVCPGVKPVSTVKVVICTPFKGEALCVVWFSWQITVPFGLAKFIFISACHSSDLEGLSQSKTTKRYLRSLAQIPCVNTCFRLLNSTPQQPRLVLCGHILFNLIIIRQCGLQ